MGLNPRNVVESDLLSLDEVFCPVSRLLERQLSVRVFNLSLHPLSRLVRYFGLGHVPAPRAASTRKLVSWNPQREADDQNTETLLHWLEKKGLADPKTCQNIDDLDRLAIVLERCCNNDKNTSGRLIDMAVGFLRRHSVPLGCKCVINGLPDEAPLHWPRGSELTKVCFQDVLDILHYQVDRNTLIQKNPEGYAFLPTSDEGKPGPVLQLSKYMQRANLVTSTSFEVFLAEYLYHVLGGQQPLEQQKSGWPRPSLLNHYFLPLSGLGQWRAAACWLAASERGALVPPDFQATMQSLLEELCSQAIIDLFGTKLIEAQKAGGPGEGVRFEALIRAFAVLWWSETIALYEGNRRICQAARDDAGNLVLQAHDGVASPNVDAESAARGEASQLIQFQIARPGKLAQIFLNISTLSRVVGESPGALVGLLGFDRVVFHTYLMDANADLNPYNGIMGRRLGSALINGLLVRRQTRENVIQTLSHAQKNLFDPIMWDQALRDLANLPDPGDERSRQVLANAKAALSLFILVKGMGDLQTICSLRESGHLFKISDWTHETQLQMWNNNPGQTFRAYVNGVQAMVHLLCYGRGYHDGFLLKMVEDEETGATQSWSVTTSEPPVGWLSRLARETLPPFTANRLNGPIATLSALLEPVTNAIDALLEKSKPVTNGIDPVLRPTDREQGAPGLYVEVVNRINRIPDGGGYDKGVIVRLGNRMTPNPDMPEQDQRLFDRVVQFRDLLRATQLATIYDEGPEGPRLELHSPAAAWGLAQPDWGTWDRKRRVYWLTVALHPNHLAREILVQSRRRAD